MVEALHARGIQVVVDIVPNHTSDLHAWFQEALAAGAARRRASATSSARDGPTAPSRRRDWMSLFGGSAWERVDDGQWYLHNFAREQPDLELGPARRCARTS